MKISTAFAFSMALWLAPAPLVAADGVLIVQKITIGPRNLTNQVQIEKERMRTEVQGVNGEKQVLVFDGPKQVLTMIYPDRKAYAEMTKAEADRMGVPVTVSPELQAQMAKMPPAQRALIEQMMRGRNAGPAAAPPPTKLIYRRAGSDKVGKWTCDKYEGFQGTVKKMDVCTVDSKALGVAMADFDITRQMAAFFGKMAPQGGTFEVGTVETVGFAGVPVRTIGYGTKGEVVYSSEISEVSRQNFPASSYAVPAGFQKQASMFSGRGAKP